MWRILIFERPRKYLQWNKLSCSICFIQICFPYVHTEYLLRGQWRWTLLQIASWGFAVVPLRCDKFRCEDIQAYGVCIRVELHRQISHSCSDVNYTNSFSFSVKTSASVVMHPQFTRFIMHFIMTFFPLLKSQKSWLKTEQRIRHCTGVEAQHFELLL